MQIPTDVVLGVFIGLSTALLWGISTNVYKSQSEEATPLAISVVKMWLSGVFMAFIVLLPFRTEPFYIPLDSIFFLVASVTVGLVVGDLVYLISQEKIGVSYAFPIANIFPITTYIFAVFLVGEEIVLLRFVGVIVAIIGVIQISRASAKKSTDEIEIDVSNLGGIALALLAAICWSLGSIFLQIGVTDVNPIDANFIRMLFGSFIMLPLFIGARQQGMPIPNKRSVKIIMFGGFLGMALGSLFYTYTVQLIGAATASLLGSTAPLFALPISIFGLNEEYTALSVLGAILTVIGVILVVLAI
ncbi:MAG: EamA family transporter [Candidatus Lokiarchaeota archaeon]|nr:EamA family transporter [Candidatus Lokiarchaeota archaeon]